MNSLLETVKYSIEKKNKKLILFHTDLLFAFRVRAASNNEMLRLHLEKLRELTPGMNIVMPVFNYDFLKDGSFSVNNSTSQTGVLNEFFRLGDACWRTPVPVFSFCGDGAEPIIKIDGDFIDPFGTSSMFDYLYERDALLMHYGSGFNSTTAIHYTERRSGKLSYRYDKFFSGNVELQNGTITKKTLKYHCRPMGKYLEYDWARLEGDAARAGIIEKFVQGREHVILCSLRNLTDFWVELMREYPLYLLDEKTEQWVEPMLEKLGRKFLLADFED